MCFWCTVNYSQCTNCSKILCGHCRQVLGKTDKIECDIADEFDSIMEKHLKTCNGIENDPDADICEECHKKGHKDESFN